MKNLSNYKIKDIKNNVEYACLKIICKINATVKCVSTVVS